MREPSRLWTGISGTHILDPTQKNKTSSSECHNIDSRNEDHGTPAGTKTSFQKRAGFEVRTSGGTRRVSRRSPRLPKNTRGRDSHSISNRRRGTARGRGGATL